MRLRFLAWFIALALGTSGCGNFFAHRMMQAPNTYPQWLAPKPRVQLAFKDSFFTNFPAQFVNVGPPPARLRYRVVEPADFALVATTTNWMRRGHPNYRFSFRATIPGETNAWTGAPRGTVVLLHGYGVGGFSMAPWALRLAEEGWRCVVPDLRGHGKSTGRRIYFGLKETGDLTQLLDELERRGQLAPPVHVVGDSFGAALALRWRTEDRRLARVVLLSPYAHLSNAVINISRDYAPWLPAGLLRPGIRKLPALLHVAPETLDPISILQDQPVRALFIAGERDAVAPVSEVRALSETAAPGSRLLVVPAATHEALPYFFEDLVPPVTSWLETETIP